jgi:hypothetical protein
MIPSVTNGAIIGSAASKKHEKLPRGSSATMIVLPRNHQEQHGNLPKLLTDDRENGANIPGGVSEAYAGRDGPSNIPGHSAQTHLHSVAAAISPTGTASRAASCKDLCACAEHIHWEWHVGCAAHHTHQPWRGGCRRPCWRDLTFSTVVCTWQNGQRGQGGNCHMYLANLLRLPAPHCV